MDGMDFLASLTGAARAAEAPSSTSRPWKIGTVTVSGTWPVDKPFVTFDGETTLSGKRYAVVSGYFPRNGDRVVMAPVGTTYVIVGPVGDAAWGVREDGRFIWGSSTGPDTNLYRASAAVLRSDSTFISGGQYGDGSDVSTANISTITTVHTITNMIFKTGVAYRAEFAAWLISDNGARRAHLRLYKTNTSGQSLGEFGRYLGSGTTINQANPVTGVRLIRNSTAADITATVIMTCVADGGTVQLIGGAGYERWLNIAPCGAAADYAGRGVAIT